MLWNYFTPLLFISTCKVFRFFSPHYFLYTVFRQVNSVFFLKKFLTKLPWTSHESYFYRIRIHKLKICIKSVPVCLSLVTKVEGLCFFNILIEYSRTLWSVLSLTTLLVWSKSDLDCTWALIVFDQGSRILKLLIWGLL